MRFNRFQMTLFLFLLSGFLPFAGCTSGKLNFEGAERIVQGIQPTDFPADTFRVTAFGAIGDGMADDRRAILDAIDACSESGGGVVLLTRGSFFSRGPISLKSHVNLHLASGATLRFSAEPADFLPPVFTRWEGVEIFNYSPMIYFTNSYHSYRGGNAPTAFHHIFLENIRCNFAANVIQLQGLEEMPLHDIYIDGVTVQQADRIFSKKEFFHDVFLKEVYVTGSRIEITE